MAPILTKYDLSQAFSHFCQSYAVGYNLSLSLCSSSTVVVGCRISFWPFESFVLFTWQSIFFVISHRILHLSTLLSRCTCSEADVLLFTLLKQVLMGEKSCDGQCSSNGLRRSFRWTFVLLVVQGQ